MPLGDVLQMLQIVGGLDAQRKAQELAAKQQSQGAYGDFTKIVGTIRDPGERTQFINSYAQQTGVDPAALAQIASNSAPTIAGTNAELQADFVRGQRDPGFAASQTPGYMNYAEQVASQVGTGQGVGDQARQTNVRDIYNQYAKDNTPFGEIMRKQLASHVLTGGSAGQAVLDAAVSNLPQGTIDSGARIGLGTQLSAGQTQQGNLERSGQQVQREGQQLQAGIAASDANYRDRALAQTGVLGAAGIDQRAAAAAARAQQQKTAIDDARKRLINNLQFVTKNATTLSVGSMMGQQIQEDYDLIHGPGAFTKDYGINPDLSPSAAVKLLQRF